MYRGGRGKEFWRARNAIAYIFAVVLNGAGCVQGTSEIELPMQVRERQDTGERGRIGLIEILLW